MSASKKGKYCGAKKRNGQLCKAMAMANGRCRLHGGKTSGGGAPKNNKNGIKAGNYYSKYLTAEEQATLDGLELGTIDNEIGLLRIRLMRALDEEQKQAALIGDEVMQIEERKDSIPALINGVRIDGADLVEERTFKRKDWSIEIRWLTDKIATLEVKREQLNALQLNNKRATLDLEQAEKIINGTTDKGSKQSEYMLKPDEETPANPVI